MPSIHEVQGLKGPSSQSPRLGVLRGHSPPISQRPQLLLGFAWLPVWRAAPDPQLERPLAPTLSIPLLDGEAEDGWGPWSALGRAAVWMEGEGVSVSVLGLL